MKVSLVVASGVHQGKVVPIVGAQFLIGRDPECQLRPASQAVSKQHCAILVRDGAVYLKDFGSTNGTVLNDAIVKEEERLLRHNDRIQIGPLDFAVRVEPTAPRDDGTPLPDINPEASAAIAAVKAAAGAVPKAVTRDATPAPKSPSKGVAAPAPAKAAPGSKVSPALKPEAKETPAPNQTPSSVVGAGVTSDEEHDRLAAMLLGLEDGDVPGGSTIVDMPIRDLTDPAGAEAAKGEAAKPEEKAKKDVPTREGMSNAASDILRKYMRRPK